MKIFQGTLVHSTNDEAMAVLQDRLLGVDLHGKIAFVRKSKELASTIEEFGVSSEDIIVLKQGEFLIPGFVDTHIHASQYVNAGTGLDLSLLGWLETYTFPAEREFRDENFAKDAYSKAVKCILKNGTTTACYFATIHLEASKILADVVEEQGQRAFVGKVNMDRNSPDYYTEETEQSIKDTEQFAKYILQKKNPLVTPVVTPRFAPTSTNKLMTQLGDIAAKHELPIQSHLSENQSECRWVKELYPDCENYTKVYDEHQLLTSKTVMAHCIYLNDREIDLIKQRGVGVAHCPNSNISLSSGFLDVQRLLSKGVKVGLGTDVSGGYSPSILNAIRCAVHTSNTVKLNQQTDNEYKSLDHKDAFRLATLGGAQVLGLDKQIGNFEVGKDFDALRISTRCSDSPFDIFERDSFLDIIQKFIYLGDDRNIKEVYVCGKQVC